MWYIYMQAKHSYTCNENSISEEEEEEEEEVEEEKKETESAQREA